MSNDSSILITVLLIDNNRWWSHSTNVEHQVLLMWLLECGEYSFWQSGRSLALVDSGIWQQLSESSYIHLWLSWWERAALNKQWTARVEAGRMGRFFESCCTRSPLLLLFTVPYNVCVSQKLNFGKNLLKCNEDKIKNLSNFIYDKRVGQ